MTQFLAPFMLLGWLQSYPADLGTYVNRDDPSTRWQVEASGESGPKHIKLTSLTWRNGPWIHDIITATPGSDARQPKPKNSNVAFLFVTGGKPNPADQAMAESLAKQSGMPVYSIFQIPNQPIEGRNEDDLIAHTFQMYMEGGSAEDILLLPMAKSVKSAMDAIQATTKDSPQPIRRFIVFGASKRGWTTWLAAATQDRRIVGIAPCVFDNLNFANQLEHQIASWGKYSEMIGDYTSRGLESVVTTPAGKKLVSIVDPYTYRAVIRCPVLIVNGSNDRYWTVDALSRYVDGLRMPLSVCIVPNAGHGLGDGLMMVRGIAGFGYAIAAEKPFPAVKMRYEASKNSVIIQSMRQSTAIYDLWVAYSDTRDFRDCSWAPIPVPDRLSARPVNQLEMPLGLKKKFTAVLAMTEYTLDGRTFQTTSPVLVLNSETKKAP